MTRPAPPPFVPVTVRLLEGNVVCHRRHWVNPRAVAYFARRGGRGQGGHTVVTLVDGREWHVEESVARLAESFMCAAEGGAPPAGREGRPAGSRD